MKRTQRITVSADEREAFVEMGQARLRLKITYDRGQYSLEVRTEDGALVVCPHLSNEVSIAVGRFKP